jgi:hypothetical protein
VKALFFMSHPGHVRNFEWTLRELAARGHGVHVAFDHPEKPGLGSQDRIVAAISAGSETVSFGDAPRPRADERWTQIAWQLRAIRDWARYFEPPFRHASLLRERAAGQVPGPVAAALRPVLQRAPARRALHRSLGALERSVPPRASVQAFLDEHRPDLVLVTPLLELGSPQLDYVRAAKLRGIPTCLCVASWDNLTNKGLLHDQPELVTVWNDAQRREAEALHGVPDGRVAVTGAEAYDHWFGWRPSRTRAEVCEAAGLPDGPYVLYAASSSFLAPDEGSWIVRWARAVRATGAGIVVRPHPLAELRADRVSELESLGAAVWPRDGANPIDGGSRADYFDSMHHASAVVGINTSAMIEAAILRKPVLTVLVPEFERGQTGTLHFGHLLVEHGGPATAAPTLQEHVGQLASTLAGDPPHAPVEEFLTAFVRPFGLDEPASPRLVDALEGLSAQRPEEVPASPRALRAARPLLTLAGNVGLRLRTRTQSSRAASTRG